MCVFAEIRLAYIECAHLYMWCCSNLNLKHPSESEITTYGAVFILLRITLWGKKVSTGSFTITIFEKTCCVCLVDVVGEEITDAG